MVSYVFSQLFNSTPSESEGRQAGPPCQSKLSSCPLYTHRRAGSLTTHSCQFHSMLTLGRPVNGNGGDKCMADQGATKTQPMHTNTRQQNAQFSIIPACSLALFCSLLLSSLSLSLLVLLLTLRVLDQFNKL